MLSFWNFNFTVTNLLSLPTELIVQVFTSCPTVQTATRLSSVNKEMHAIWIKHTHQILEDIIRPQIPAYEDATEIAKLQNSLLSTEQPTDATKVSSVNEAPAVRHFHLLLRNATLASNVVDSHRATLATYPKVYQLTLDFTHAHAMYYLSAKLVLAHRSQDEHLKRALYSTLKSASELTVVAHLELVRFLHVYTQSAGSAGILHGIPIHMCECGATTEWRYSFYAVNAAYDERFHRVHGGDTRLEDVISKEVYRHLEV